MGAVDYSQEAEDDRRLDRAKRTNTKLRQRIRALEIRTQEAEKTAEILTGLEDINTDPPTWIADTPSGHSATPLLLITDTHFGEVVQPDEILGLNAYNAEIAEQRLQRAFENAVRVSKHYFGGKLKYDGIVLAFGGDIFTGEIHDELTETNDLTPIEAFDHYIDPMVAGIKLLRQEFGKVHVAGVDGNHDRRQKKKKAKRSVRSSWSWLFYRVLAREFSRFSTVTWQIPDSRDTVVPVYDTRFLLHHGDQFRGGSGISGALSPLMIGDARKRKKHDAAVRYTGREDLHFDIQLMGHFHHRIALPGVVVGGCLKGYDEYSMVQNYPYEPPSQELMVVTPEHGVTFQAPVWVQDRGEEGW